MIFGYKKANFLTDVILPSQCRINTNSPIIPFKSYEVEDPFLQPTGKLGVPYFIRKFSLCQVKLRNFRATYLFQHLPDKLSTFLAASRIPSILVRYFGNTASFRRKDIAFMTFADDEKPASPKLPKLRNVHYFSLEDIDAFQQPITHTLHTSTGVNLHADILNRSTAPASLSSSVSELQSNYLILVNLNECDGIEEEILSLKECFMIDEICTTDRFIVAINSRVCISRCVNESFERTLLLTDLGPENRCISMITRKLIRQLIIEFPLQH